nr:unnamed protein product [Spirometra erinaceieuropaei]
MSYCPPHSPLYADVPPYACRQSRLDSFLHADPAPQVTLYRTHSVRRISEHQCNSRTPQAPCFRRACSISRKPQSEVCPTRPTVLPVDACCGSSPPRCQSPQRPRGRVSVHCSPVANPERTVRFGSCTSINSCDTPAGRILFARRSSPSPCRRRAVRCSSPPEKMPVRGRDSSICRVISRSSSPCEEILTASLPSRASCTATSSGSCNLTRIPTCCSCTTSNTSGCSPLRRPTCRPKPQRNLKYHYMFENNCSNPEEDLSLPLPPPPEANCCVPRCRTPTPPPPCEVAVSSCFDTKPDFGSPLSRPLSCVECCSTTTSSSSTFGSCRRMTTQHRVQSSCRQTHLAERWTNYLDYINRKENELVCQLNECDLDLSAFAGMMRTEVADFVRDVVGRGRVLISHDLPRLLNELCCCMPLDRTCSGSENFDQLWKRTEDRIRDLDRLLERVNRMRLNGWLE